MLSAIDVFLTQLRISAFFILLLSALAASSHAQDKLTKEKFLTELRDDSGNNKERAIEQALSEGSGDLLVVALQFDDHLVQIQAAIALGTLKAKNTVPLLKPLLNNKEPFIKAGAIYALQRIDPSIKTPGILDALMPALKNRSHLIRGKAIEVLSKLDGKQQSSVAFLIAAMKDTDADIRKAAVAALSGSQDPRVFEIWIKMLKDDPSTEVKGYLLENLSSAHAHLIKAGHKATHWIKPGLESQDAYIRTQSLETLSQLDKTSPEAIRIYTKALDDENDEVRRVAVLSLSQTKDHKIIKKLVQMLSDDASSLVQNNIMDIIQHNHDNKYNAELVAAFRKKRNDSVRSGFATLFRQIRHRTMLWPLIITMRNATESEETRVAATYAVAKFNHPDATKPLIKNLSAKNSKLLKATLIALGEIKHPDHLKILIKHFSTSKYPDIRANIAGALGDLGKAEAADELIKALKDKDAVIRSYSAWALGRIGEKKALKPLEALLSDADKGVKAIANRSIHLIEPSRYKQKKKIFVSPEGDDVVVDGKVVLSTDGDIQWQALKKMNSNYFTDRFSLVGQDEAELSIEIAPDQKTIGFNLRHDVQSIIGFVKLDGGKPKTEIVATVFGHLARYGNLASFSPDGRHYAHSAYCWESQCSVFIRETATHKVKVRMSAHGYEVITPENEEEPEMGVENAAAGFEFVRWLSNNSFEYKDPGMSMEKTLEVGRF